MQVLKELLCMVAAHTSTWKTVVDSDGAGLISSLLGPFTSHTVGSEAIAILVNLPPDSESKQALMQPTNISLVVNILNEGTIETKVNCLRFIGMLMEEKDFQLETVSSLSLLVGLLRLVKDKRHPSGIIAGLCLLKAICSHKHLQSSMVSVFVWRFEICQLCLKMSKNSNKISASPSGSGPTRAAS